MARVNADNVRDIMNDLDEGMTDAKIDACIIAANILTDKVRDEGGITDTAHLTEIERWLAGHFVKIVDVRSSEEREFDAAQKFQYKVDLNLAQTQYGQQAIILDTSGYLASLQKDAEKGVTDVVIQGISPEIDYAVEDGLMWWER